MTFLIPLLVIWSTLSLINKLFKQNQDSLFFFFFVKKKCAEMKIFQLEYKGAVLIHDFVLACPKNAAKV